MCGENCTFELMWDFPPTLTTSFTPKVSLNHTEITIFDYFLLELFTWYPLLAIWSGIPPPEPPYHILYHSIPTSRFHQLPGGGKIWYLRSSPGSSGGIYELLNFPSTADDEQSVIYFRRLVESPHSGDPAKTGRTPHHAIGSCPYTLCHMAQCPGLSTSRLLNSVSVLTLAFCPVLNLIARERWFTHLLTAPPPHPRNWWTHCRRSSPPPSPGMFMLMAHIPYRGRPSQCQETLRTILADEALSLWLLTPLLIQVSASTDGCTAAFARPWGRRQYDGACGRRRRHRTVTPLFT